MRREMKLLRCRCECSGIKDSLDRTYLPILDLIPRTEESSHLWCDEVVEQATVGAIYKNLLDFVVSALLLHHFQKLIRAAKDFSSRPLHANVVAQIISSRNIVPVAHRFDVGHHSFFCTANHTN